MGNGCSSNAAPGAEENHPSSRPRTGQPVRTQPRVLRRGSNAANGGNPDRPVSRNSHQVSPKKQLDTEGKDPDNNVDVAQQEPAPEHIAQSTQTSQDVKSTTPSPPPEKSGPSPVPASTEENHTKAPTPTPPTPSPAQEDTDTHDTQEETVTVEETPASNAPDSTETTTTESQPHTETTQNGDAPTENQIAPDETVTAPNTDSLVNPVGSSSNVTACVFKEEAWHEDFLAELNRQRLALHPNSTEVTLHFDLCLLAQKEADRLRNNKITTPKPTICEPQDRLFKNTPCNVVSRVTIFSTHADIKAFLANAITSVNANTDDEENQSEIEEANNIPETDKCFWVDNGVVGCAKTDFYVDADLYYVTVMMFYKNVEDNNKEIDKVQEDVLSEEVDTTQTESKSIEPQTEDLPTGEIVENGDVDTFPAPAEEAGTDDVNADTTESGAPLSS